MATIFFRPQCVKLNDEMEAMNLPVLLIERYVCWWVIYKHSVNMVWPELSIAHTDRLIPINGPSLTD